MTMMRSLVSILLLSSTAFAHMQMLFPPPFRSKFNAFSDPNKIDYSMTSPISAAGLPCKGYQVDLGTPGGASVVTWARGSNVNFTLAGETFHNGGSCQVALSTDKGKTWYVIHTWQGGCPLNDGPFNFDIPSDVPTGPALFSWSWINHSGNREFYTNCASITIASGGGAAPKVAFTSRPDLCLVNLSNGCVAVDEMDILIPNPGPDVTNAGTPSQPAKGTCAPVNGIGGRGSSGSSGLQGGNSARASSTQEGYPGPSDTQGSESQGDDCRLKGVCGPKVAISAAPLMCSLPLIFYLVYKPTRQLPKPKLTNLPALLAVFLFSSTALGHMEMTWPPAFRSKYNPHVASNLIDYTQNSPLNNNTASQFPCKGYHVDMGTPSGASVVNWNQGGNYNFTLLRGTNHAGGSCQAALSYDAGKTWYVIHTYQGGCPLSDTSNFDIPSDAPTGTAVFGWLWYNKIGNREIYMNCASVTIATGSGPAPKVAFTSRPDLYVANFHNGCVGVDSTVALIPNPGLDVTTNNTENGVSAIGTCAPVNGIGGRISSGSTGSAGSEINSAASKASPPASSVSAQIVPTSSATLVGGESGAGGDFITVPPSSATNNPVVSVAAESSAFPLGSSSPVATDSPSATGSAPSSQATDSGSSGTASGVSPTKDGQCSGSQTCAGQTYWGSCCSQWGYCGTSEVHCGAGCMAAFGTCGLNNTNTTGTRRSRRLRHFNS